MLKLMVLELVVDGESCVPMMVSRLGLAKKTIDREDLASLCKRGEKRQEFKDIVAAISAAK